MTDAEATKILADNNLLTLTNDFGELIELVTYAMAAADKLRTFACYFTPGGRNTIITGYDTTRTALLNHIRDMRARTIKMADDREAEGGK